jgi:hypothetical protein
VSSRYRRNATWIIGALVGCAVFAGVAVHVTSGSEKTRECTVESIKHVSVRRGMDYDMMRTAECGRIQVAQHSRIRVLAADCERDTLHIGSRYRMTTVGFDFLFLTQRLVGGVGFIEAGPGYRCTSDWFTDRAADDIGMP